MHSFIERIGERANIYTKEKLTQLFYNYKYIVAMLVLGACLDRILSSVSNNDLSAAGIEVNKNEMLLHQKVVTEIKRRVSLKATSIGDDEL